jgi:hypothetical protein
MNKSFSRHIRRGSLFWEASTLHHSRVLFLESESYSFGTLHLFINTSHDTAFFAGAQGLGGKFADTVIETALDEVLIGL